MASVLLRTHRDGDARLRWFVGCYRHVRRWQPPGTHSAERSGADGRDCLPLRHDRLGDRSLAHRQGEWGAAPPAATSSRSCLAPLRALFRCSRGIFIGRSVAFGATLPGKDCSTAVVVMGEAVTTFGLIATLCLFLGFRELRRYTPFVISFLYAVMVPLEAHISGTSTIRSQFRSCTDLGTLGRMVDLLGRSDPRHFGCDPGVWLDGQAYRGRKALLFRERPPPLVSPDGWSLLGTTDFLLVELTTFSNILTACACRKLDTNIDCPTELPHRKKA